METSPRIPLSLLLCLTLLAGCDSGEAPRTPAPARVPSGPDSGTAASAAALQRGPQAAAAAPAPLTETVVASSTPSPEVSRQMVEPAPQGLRITGFDVASYRASIARLRGALDESERERFDNSVMAVVSNAAREAAKTDPAGPLGAVLDGMAALQGRSAAEVFAMAGAEAGSDPAARSHANESAAVATLKNISSAQAQCQASGVIDVDANGAGEYGSFGELSGARSLRGTLGEGRMSPPVLSAAFGKIEQGVVVRSGYVFRMYLPSSLDGHFVAEAQEGGADRIGVDNEAAEVLWRAYAWPLEHGVSGSRVFYVDQSGDVLACSNAQRWSGPRFGPDAHAASSTSDPLRSAANAQGRSGDEWVVVR